MSRRGGDQLRNRFRRAGGGIGSSRRRGPAHIYIGASVRRRRWRRLALALVVCALVAGAVWIAIARADADGFGNHSTDGSGPGTSGRPAAAIRSGDDLRERTGVTQGNEVVPVELD